MNSVFWLHFLMESNNINSLFKGMPMPYKKAAPIFPVIVLCLVGLVFSGCTENEEKQATAPEARPLKVSKVETRDMPNWGEFIGQISAVDTVDIRARVEGFLIEKQFEEGGAVKKGDLLFVIDPKPFDEDLKEAQSELEYNQALMEKAKKDMARYSKLLEEGVVSQTEFESYQTSFSTYQAKVRQNKAQVENANIQLGYTKIYSPIDGIIGRVQVDVGNLVGKGESTLLATISTVDPVYVSFSVNESDYLKAKRNREQSNLPDDGLRMLLSDGTEYEHSGQLSMVDRAVDPKTGTLGIRVQFPNPEGLLRPGQYSRVRILIEQTKDAIVVPSRSIINVQGMTSIYKVDENNMLVNQPVETGYEVDNFVVVKKGLSPEDIIVTDDIRRLRPGMEIKPIIVPMTKPGGEEVDLNSSQPTESNSDQNGAENKDG